MGVSVKIQSANAQHLTEIVALLADDDLGATREEARFFTRYQSAFEAIQGDPNAQILIARTGDKTVGCLQLNILANLSFAGTKRGLIEGVRVHKSLQGQGIGRKLFDAAIAICRANQCGMVQLTTNKQRADAASFYEKLGFVGSHIGFKLQL